MIKNYQYKKIWLSIPTEELELSVQEGLVLLIACGGLNHLASKYLERYSFASRLFEEEKRLIVDMSRSLIHPRDIFHTLKQKII